jgi:3-phosphoshikimate 1-carboxyvinyltransferase
VALAVDPAVSLRGDLAVPGDKSISHRALLFGAVADGESRFTGFGASADTLSTAAGMRSLGAEVEVEGDAVRVGGVGLRGLQAPGVPIDCGNSGTLMRLLPGLLVGQEGRPPARRVTRRVPLGGSPSRRSPRWAPRWRRRTGMRP